jgi:hypothetical protein
MAPYNPNSELYTHCSFRFEQESSGRLVASTRFQSFRFMTSWVLEILLLVLGAEKLLRELIVLRKTALKNRRVPYGWMRYFTRTVYNYIELLNILFIFAHVLCTVLVYNTDVWRDWQPVTVDRYVDFHEIAKYYKWAVAAQGTSFVLTSLSLFKYLELMPAATEWYVIGATVERGGRALRGAMGVATLMLTGCAIVCNQTFGSYMLEFSDFYRSFVSMFRIVTSDAEILHRAGHVTTQLNAFALAVMGVILAVMALILIPGMFIAILTDSLSLELERRQALFEVRPPPPFTSCGRVDLT